MIEIEIVDICLPKSSKVCPRVNESTFNLLLRAIFLHTDVIYIYWPTEMTPLWGSVLKCMCQRVGGGGVVLIYEAGTPTWGCIVEKYRTSAFEELLNATNATIIAWCHCYRHVLFLKVHIKCHLGSASADASISGNCDSGPNGRLTPSFPLRWSKSRSWLVSGPCSQSALSGNMFF